MYESRTMAVNTARKRPKIFIDKSFIPLVGVDVGKKGQLNCSLRIVGINKEMDPNGNEILNYEIEIVNVNSVVMND